MTSEQLRMARAALKIGVRELSALANVDKMSIVGIENGRTRGYASTRKKLRDALETAGVVFIEAKEGIHGATVALKWGFEPMKDGDSQTYTDGDGTSGGLNSLAWDEAEDFDLADAEASGEPAEAEEWDSETKAEQIQYWRERPERWASLHEVSRQCLLRAMGVSSLGAS